MFFYELSVNLPQRNLTIPIQAESQEQASWPGSLP